jgi:hypothetical protein
MFLGKSETIFLTGQGTLSKQLQSEYWKNIQHS